MYYFRVMAAMIQVPTKLPQEVVDAIKKAVDEKRFKNRNALIVEGLIKFLKIKKR